MTTSAAATTLSVTADSIRDYDAITAVMERYNEAVRTGSSAVMKPVFHESATFFGYYHDGTLLAGPAQILFDWVDANGPAANLNPRIVSIDIYGSIASVRIELEGLAGKLVGAVPDGRLSDLFQLIKIGGEWKISQKSFHWHTS